MNKRGISPLVATVILISFAVALGAVIMNWGNRVYENQTNTTLKCEELSFSVHKFQDGGYDLCFSKRAITFTVESFQGDINNMKMVAYTSGENLYTVPNILTEKLRPGEPQRISVPYDGASYGDVVEIQLFPMVGTTLCNDFPISATVSGPCES